jgi:hypothetical protein
MYEDDVTDPRSVHLAFPSSLRHHRAMAQRSNVGGVDGPGHEAADGPLHPVDFATHVLSLASSAMVALGQMPSPGGETTDVDLDTARYLIDVLGMLEEKTRGNLDDSESRLLQSLIYDLRVAFVDANKAAAQSAK